MRPIDADALLRKLREQQKYSSITDIRGLSKSILEVIHAPTIPAQPVKRGKWIVSSDGYYPYCSECGDRPQKITNYCANCGAKMEVFGNE